MKWSWHTGPVAADQLCYHCKRPLRLHAGAGVVRWWDENLYATGCLLDDLATIPPVTECWKS